MPLTTLAALLGVWVAVLVVPGPDIVQVMRVAPRSMTRWIARWRVHIDVVAGVIFVVLGAVMVGEGFGSLRA